MHRAHRLLSELTLILCTVEEQARWKANARRLHRDCEVFPSRMIPPITIIVVSNKPRRRVAGAGQPPGGEITPAPEQAAKPEAELPSVPYAPDAVSETGVLSFSRTAMTIIEIRPHGNGWKVFEAPGVEPVFPQKNQAINYAQSRA